MVGKYYLGLILAVLVIFSVPTALGLTPEITIKTDEPFHNTVIRILDDVGNLKKTTYPKTDENGVAIINDYSTSLSQVKFRIFIKHPLTNDEVFNDEVGPFDVNSKMLVDVSTGALDSDNSEDENALEENTDEVTEETQEETQEETPEENAEEAVQETEEENAEGVDVVVETTESEEAQTSELSETEAKRSGITGMFIAEKGGLTTTSYYSIALVIVIVIVLFVVAKTRRKMLLSRGSIPPHMRTSRDLTLEEELRDAQKKIKEARAEIKEVKKRKSEIDQAEADMKKAQERLSRLKGEHQEIQQKIEERREEIKENVQKVEQAEQQKKRDILPS